MHHYNSTQYCKTETVFSIFPFLQTNITSQMWPSRGKGGPPRLKVNYSITSYIISLQRKYDPLTLLEDLKPLVEARLRELFRLFCLPQSDKVGTPMKCVLGGRYRVCVKDLLVVVPKIQFLNYRLTYHFWSTHHCDI